MSNQLKTIDSSRLAYKGSTVLRDWNAARQAERQKVSNQVTVTRSDSHEQLVNLLGGPASGFAVTPETSMRISAVFASVRLIAGSIAGLPIPIYRRTDQGREVAPIDDLWHLLNEQPHPLYTAAAAWEWIAASNCLRGDGYKQIIRNRNGTIKWLLPWHPDRVRGETVAGRMQYYCQPKDGRAFGLDQDDMLHFPGFGFDGERSMSVIQFAAFNSVGVALAADDMIGKFYKNGATPKHLFETPKEMSDDLITKLRNQYEEKYAGPENTGKPMVLTEGLTVKELSMNMVDAQLLESRKYQVIDIARAFGVPPHMIGAQESTSSWGSGLEEMTLAYIRFTLLPWLTRYKQELNRKIFRDSTEFYIDFDTAGLSAGDSEAEDKSLREALGGSQGPGYMTLDEVRRKKNLPPIGGDVGNSIYVPKGKDNAQTPSATN